ncbi:MAG: helix-turn-helix domain-containing protein [Faecousia sp.]
MNKKNTNELQKELTAASDLSRFLSENRAEFVDADFLDTLLTLFQESGLSKSALAKNAGTSEVYLYQIFSGLRMPSRDRILCLCFGMSVTLEQTQELLKRSNLAQLYPKNRRDAIVIYAISHSLDLMAANDLLFAENEPTLC